MDDLQENRRAHVMDFLNILASQKKAGLKPPHGKLASFFPGLKARGYSIKGYCDNIRFSEIFLFKYLTISLLSSVFAF